MELYSGRTEVIEFLRERHGNQTRIHGAPYFLHPIAVTEIVHGMGVRDRDILIASDCHDLLEDTETTTVELIDRYGRNVTQMVSWLTKAPKQGLSPDEKEAATIGYYFGLRRAPNGVKIIKIGDRVHNLSEFEFCNRKFQRRYILDTLWLLEALKGHTENIGAINPVDVLDMAFQKAVTCYANGVSKN